MSDFLLEKVLALWKKSDKAVLDKQTFPCDVCEIRDIPYSDDKNRAHLLDVYYPQNNTEKMPPVVDIHGGGFINGDKELHRFFASRLAARGFTVFSINYRLAPQTKMPAQIQDTVAAINWVYQHCHAYYADKNCMHICGESAGGLLAVIASLIFASARLQGVFAVQAEPVIVRSLAVICGMMHFDSANPAFALLRGYYFEKGYKKTDCYRTMLLHKVPELPNLPPLFVSSSEQDQLRFMTVFFKKILNARHIPYDFLDFKKGVTHRLVHVFQVMHQDYPETAFFIDRLCGFFDSHYTRPL